MEHVYKQIWLFEVTLIKGDNSEHYKIVHINKNFEMLYTKNHRTHFYENYSAS